MVLSLSLTSNMKGAPIYWIRPKNDDVLSYIDKRIPKMRRYMKLQDSQYRPVDKSEEFLRKLTDQFISKFVILNIDLKGSTNLSQRMTLLSNSLLIGCYSREMALIVENYRGFVLKYQGDGVIAYFPVPTFWGMDDNALDCAVLMKFLIERGLNKILQEYNMPSVGFRIGLDTGEAIVTTVGDSSNKAHKDLIGPTINLTSKIQTEANENKIVIGATMWRRLGVHRRKIFQEYKPKEWKYELPTAPGIYPIYVMKDYFG